MKYYINGDDDNKKHSESANLPRAAHSLGILYF